MKTLMSVILALEIVAIGLLAADATNQISAQVYVKAEKGNSSIERKTGVQYAQWAGQRYNTYVVSCTNTAWIPMAKGSVGSCGMTFARALFTNAGPIVYLSFDNGTTTNLSFKAGEAAMFRLISTFDITQACVKASVATNLLDFEFTVIED